MKSERKNINSVVKTLNILECFCSINKELRLTEISKQLNMPKSTASNLIRTLVETGYLEQNPENSKYRLGNKVFILGKFFEKHLSIEEVVKPYLEMLRNKFNETFRFVIPAGRGGLCIEEVESTQSIIVQSVAGKGEHLIIPLYCTANGKNILASMSEKKLEETLDSIELTKLTKFTITDREVLRKEIKEIQTKGYNITSEEGELGLMGIAVPIYNSQMKFLGSIGMAAPVARVSEKLIEEVIQELLKTAEIIFSKL